MSEIEKKETYTENNSTETKETKEENTTTAEELDSLKESIKEQLTKQYAEEARNIPDIANMLEANNMWKINMVLSLFGIDVVEIAIGQMLEKWLMVKLLMPKILSQLAWSSSFETKIKPLLEKIAKAAETIEKAKNPGDLAALHIETNTTDTKNTPTQTTTPETKVENLSTLSEKEIFKKMQEYSEDILKEKDAIEKDADDILGSWFLLTLLKKFGAAQKDFDAEKIDTRTSYGEKIKTKDATQGNRVVYKKDNETIIALVTGEMNHDGEIAIVTEWWNEAIPAKDATIYQIDYKKLYETTHE